MLSLRCEERESGEVMQEEQRRGCIHTEVDHKTDKGQTVLLMIAGGGPVTEFRVHTVEKALKEQVG